MQLEQDQQREGQGYISTTQHQPGTLSSIPDTNKENSEKKLVRGEEQDSKLENKGKG